MVHFENVFLEIIGFVIIGGASFSISQFFTISPFDKSWSKLSNSLLFCTIPLAVYIAFRLYFAVVFYLTSKIPSNYKKIEQIASTLLVSTGIAFAAYQPKVQTVFFSVYAAQVGNLPNIIYDLSKPSVEKSYAFGLKILGLLFGWFLLLFCVELVLRVVVLIIGFVLRNTVCRNANKLESTVDKDKLE